MSLSGRLGPRGPDLMSKGSSGRVWDQRSNVSWVTVTWGPPVNRQIWIKTLPSINFFGWQLNLFTYTLSSINTISILKTSKTGTSITSDWVLASSIRATPVCSHCAFIYITTSVPWRISCVTCKSNKNKNIINALTTSSLQLNTSVTCSNCLPIISQHNVTCSNYFPILT